jgi:outer membrane immunogenic protein
MKKLLLFPFLMLLAFNTFGQLSKQEQKQLNAGVGLSSWGLPLYVGLDYGITDEITIGGEFTFRSYQEKFNSIRYMHSIVGVQANANYHFAQLINDLPPEIDIYGGINAGFFLWMSPSSYPGERISRPGFGLQIGGRYALSNKLSGNLEISGGNAFAGIKMGLSLIL